MIKLQRLGHVLISVRDLERSKDFYTRILGFKVLEQDPEHGGLFLSIGGLGQTPDPFPFTNPNAVPAADAQLSRGDWLGRRRMALSVENQGHSRGADLSPLSAG